MSLRSPRHQSHPSLACRSGGLLCFVLRGGGQEEVGETRALGAQAGERGASSLWAWCFAAGHPGAVCGSLPAGRGRSWGREQDRTSARAGQGWGGGGEGQLQPQDQGDRSIRVTGRAEEGLQLSRAHPGSGARKGAEQAGPTLSSHPGHEWRGFWGPSRRWESQRERRATWVRARGEDSAAQAMERGSNLPGNKVFAQNHSGHKVLGVLHGVLAATEAKGALRQRRGAVCSPGWGGSAPAFLEPVS